MISTYEGVVDVNDPQEITSLKNAINKSLIKDGHLALDCDSQKWKYKKRFIYPKEYLCVTVEIKDEN